MRSSTNRPNPRIEPLGWRASWAYFAVPALLMAAGFYGLMPVLVRWGLLPYHAYGLSLGLPLLALWIGALVGYRLEGRPLSWRPLMARFRYQRPTWRDWLWTLAIYALQLLIFSQLARLTRSAIDSGRLPLPAGLPAFADPRTSLATQSFDAAVGGLRGNWPAFWFTVLLLIVNIVGEELWWRGLIYPRQELALGRWTWVVHGLLWCLFHAYKYWDLLSLLPMTLGLAYTVHRTRKSTTVFVAHLLGNGVGLIPILLGVLGR